jgi:hypothetical protein
MNVDFFDCLLKIFQGGSSRCNQLCDGQTDSPLPCCSWAQYALSSLFFHMTHEAIIRENFLISKSMRLQIFWVFVGGDFGDHTFDAQHGKYTFKDPSAVIPAWLIYVA